LAVTQAQIQGVQQNINNTTLQLENAQSELHEKVRENGEKITKIKKVDYRMKLATQLVVNKKRHSA
jgi:hypothetical protein